MFSQLSANNLFNNQQRYKLTSLSKQESRERESGGVQSYGFDEDPEDGGVDEESIFGELLNKVVSAVRDD